MMLAQLNEVNDHLFIGSYKSVTDEALQESSITCVVNCSNARAKYDTSNLRYIPIDILDDEFEDLSVHFDNISDVIHEEHQTGGKTVVYCAAGISRSATLCLGPLLASLASTIIILPIYAVHFYDTKGRTTLKNSAWDITHVLTTTRFKLQKQVWNQMIAGQLY